MKRAVSIILSLATLLSASFIISACNEVYTVSFDTGYGETVASQELKEGELVSRPSVERTGYTFNGWFYNGKEWNFTTDSVSGDMILTASWTINRYTLTIRNYYGDGDLTLTQDYASAISVDNPARTGYSFSGYSEPLPAAMPASDVSVEARWGVNEYTLSVRYNDGVTPDSVIRYNYGQRIEPVPVPRREGYAFAGWDKTVPAVMPEENVVINALWTLCDVSYTVSNNEVTITGLNNPDVRNLVILPEYENASVTKIAASAFKDCSSIVSVVIPSGVSFIGENAFQGCYRLVEVVNKSGLTVTAGSSANGRLGYYAKQVISSESDSKISFVSGGFSVYTTDFDVSLVGYFGNENAVFIPDNITMVDNNAFRGLTGLTSVNVPEGVTSIGDNAFYGCESLSSVVIPNGVQGFGENVFYNCSSLQSVSIPVSLDFIPDGAFYGCAQLSSVSLPDSVTGIGNNAFYGCGLRAVAIPDSVEAIGIRAFSGCSNLESIVIENGGISVSNDAFRGCPVKHASIPSAVIAGIEKGQLEELEIISGTVIDEYAVYNCASLARVLIPDSVEEIKERAFSGCSSLETVIIPESVVTMGENVFYGCSGLTINCVTGSKPAGWSDSWNSSSRPVNWGYAEN